MWVPAVEAGPLVLILLVIPLVPAAITIAVLRYQLLDIRLVVSRAVLYGLLTGGVVGSYLGLVALADLVRREIGIGSSVLATWSSRWASTRCGCGCSGLSIVCCSATGRTRCGRCAGSASG